MANDPAGLNQLKKEINRRRTFAIISHPDAGKTTLTEKLLLYGGAIHLAGNVKAKKNQKHTTSDWMEIEKQRGISISTTVLQFEYKGSQINLLDTPGHKDFSEDTYRTLMAVDAAVMLIDGAKGVEPQTQKLFEVCSMRGIPIFTFVNKMDRPTREPLDLIDELERVLGIRSCPITWPVGLGDRFKGVFDRDESCFHFFDTGGQANVKGAISAQQVAGSDDPKLKNFLVDKKTDAEEAEELLSQFHAELELLEAAGDPFDAEKVLHGQLTPVFFGSAMNNFGVQSFLEKLIKMAPAPLPRNTTEGPIPPDQPNFSGFVFKIQANMDPSHRDRVAFMRICSGIFRRNIQVTHSRMKKPLKLSMPLQFFAQERVVVEEAWPGDIVGILDTTATLRIGDTVCEKGNFEYEKVPHFSPEFFGEVQILDPMKRKQLKKGLEQLEEEGVIQIYRQPDLGDKDPVLGAVGALQFEILQHRIEAEYGVKVKIHKLSFQHARWIVGEGVDSKTFQTREDSKSLVDRDGKPVVLFTSDWALRWAEQNYPKLKFMKTAT